MKLLVSEEMVNVTKGYRYGGSEPYEPYTDDIGELFRAMRREYGACQSSVYVDSVDGGAPKRVGWVFVKRVKYDDAKSDWPREKRTYLREVWVTLHDAPDTVGRTAHFHAIG